MNGFQYGIKVVWIIQAKENLLVNYLGKRTIWVVTVFLSCMEIGEIRN